jgi:hypothetical protein
MEGNESVDCTLKACWWHRIVHINQAKVITIAVIIVNDGRRIFEVLKVIKIVEGLEETVGDELVLDVFLAILMIFLASSNNPVEGNIFVHVK